MFHIILERGCRGNTRGVLGESLRLKVSFGRLEFVPHVFQKDEFTFCYFLGPPASSIPVAFL